METLRFYTPVVFINRTAGNDETLDGYFIPKGTDVWFSPFLMNRNPVVWQSPNEFQPERFQDGKEPPAHIFPTFGVGGRSCIGKYFAINEAIIILSIIHQHFTANLADGATSVPLHKFTATLHSKTGRVPMSLQVR